MRVCIALLILAALALHVAARSAADPVENEYTVTVGGTERTFYVYVPSSYTGQTAFPLMVFWHGASDSCTEETNFMIAGYTLEQVSRHYLLATPCGINKVWSASIDVPFAKVLLSTVKADYNIDPNRIFSSGFSNGAFLTEFMGCYEPQLWPGGLAIAAGTVNSNSSSSSSSNAQILTDCDTAFAKAGTPKMHIIKLQGSKDPAVQPYGGNNLVSMRDDFYGWALRNGCKGSPTTYHEDAVYKDERFEECPENVSVRLIMMMGIPHQWVQNATFNYNTVILDNFNVIAPAKAPARRHPITRPVH